VEVTYRFHPLCGSKAVVVCDQIHNGTRHFTLQVADGTTSLVPAWMTGAAGAAFQIAERPRLPFDRLLELRALVDSLLASPAGDSNPRAGGDDGETDALPARPVRPRATPDPTAAAAAGGCRDAAEDPAGRGDGAADGDASRGGRRGGGR
jgi:Family of unknown function (DUF5372)